jgi:hypothetical protein
LKSLDVLGTLLATFYIVDAEGFRGDYAEELGKSVEKMSIHIFEKIKNFITSTVKDPRM